MSAQRTTLIPSNEIWKQLSDEDKKRINKEEQARIYACFVEDEEELMRRVDAAGSLGYKLPEGDVNDPEKTRDAVSMMLAADRLCGSNPDTFNPKPVLLVERAPFTLIRKKA